MNRKQLIVVIVLCLVVGGLALRKSRREAGEFQSSAPQIGRKLLPDFPINDVAQIVIRQSSNELVLTRVEEDWTVRDRYGYPAKFSEVGDFLRKIWDLKAVQMEQVGPSQLSRLELLEPGKGAGSGTLLEFKDKSGKSVASVLLGKQHMRKSEGASPSPYGGGEGSPDGRYLLVLNGPKDVAVVSEAFSEMGTTPDRWLNKDFFKVEKLKSISVTHTNAADSWKLAREAENGELKLADAAAAEQLDAGKSAPAGNALSYPSFTDVVSPEAKPDATGMDHPLVAKVETFDGFTYSVKVGNKAAGADDYHLSVVVTADLPKERTPGKDEKPEDKERLDKEFKEKNSKLEEKLKQEKSYEKWIYLVSKWTVDPLLKLRKDLLAEKKEEKPAAGGGAPPAPGVTLAEPPKPADSK
jgi:hypothetical protein